jgi:hypothetical protein
MEGAEHTIPINTLNTLNSVHLFMRPIHQVNQILHPFSSSLNLLIGAHRPPVVARWNRFHAAESPALHSAPISVESVVMRDEGDEETKNEIRVQSMTMKDESFFECSRTATVLRQVTVEQELIEGQLEIDQRFRCSPSPPLSHHISFGCHLRLLLSEAILYAHRDAPLVRIV